MLAPQAIESHKIGTIDLVVVNLYPFRKTVTAKPAPAFEVGKATALARRPHRLQGTCVQMLGYSLRLPKKLLHLHLPPPCLQVGVENIDIGGPAMIRGAAKNMAHVTVAVDPADYPEILEKLAKVGRRLVGTSIHCLDISKSSKGGICAYHVCLLSLCSQRAMPRRWLPCASGWHGRRSR